MSNLLFKTLFNYGVFNNLDEKELKVIEERLIKRQKELLENPVYLRASSDSEIKQYFFKKALKGSPLLKTLIENGYFIPVYSDDPDFEQTPGFYRQYSTTEQIVSQKVHRLAHSLVFFDDTGLDISVENTKDLDPEILNQVKLLSPGVRLKHFEEIALHFCKLLDIPAPSTCYRINALNYLAERVGIDNLVLKLYSSGALLDISDNRNNQSQTFSFKYKLNQDYTRQMYEMEVKYSSSFLLWDDVAGCCVADATDSYIPHPYSTVIEMMLIQWIVKGVSNDNPF